MAILNTQIHVLQLDFMFVITSEEKRNENQKVIIFADEWKK